MTAATARRGCGPIVVGIDGTQAQKVPLAWALDAAARRKLPVRVVHALVEGLDTAANGVAWGEPGGAAVRQALGFAREHAPAVTLSAAIRPGPPIRTLLAEGAEAAFLVVGSHFPGVPAGLLSGSTGLELGARAPCPVVVVRGARRAAPSRRVVVGVDGSEEAARAVEFAFEEASFRGCGLGAVHARERRVSRPVTGAGWASGRAGGNEEGRRVLSEALAGWREKYPDVPVVQDIVLGLPDRALVAASADADLLLVGARGLGGFLGLPLGSTAQAALLRAHCPVMVARTPVEVLTGVRRRNSAATHDPGR
ncbi:MAG: universal stress protein [Carbonactinosporaceae bacterium]